MSAEDVLVKAGIHIDDLNRLRLLSVEVADTCGELNTGCKDFSTQLAQFGNTTESLIKTLEDLATLVETEKLRAMSSRSALKQVEKHKGDSQQIQLMIRERQVELERLKAELAAAQKVEAEQKEQLQKLMSN